MAREISWRKATPFFRVVASSEAEVHIGSHPDAVGQTKAGISGCALEQISFRSAHPGDLWSVDFEYVETAFLSSFYKLDRLRAPELGPVSVVYSDGIHRFRRRLHSRQGGGKQEV